MQTTVYLDQALLDKAIALTRIEERSTLIREALRALIARETARSASSGLDRLARHQDGESGGSARGA